MQYVEFNMEGNPNMKVCIVSRNIAMDYKGSFEFDQAVALKQAGYDVCVISLDFRSVRRRRPFGIIYDVFNGIDVFRCSFPIGPINKRVFHHLGVFLFKKAYEKAIRQIGDFDIIHAHFIEVSYISMRAIKETFHSRIPFVVTEHSSLLNNDISNIDDDTVKEAEYVYSKADKVIAVSDALGKQIRKNFNVKYEVVYNVFDGEVFHLAPKETDGNNAFIFVSAGNFTQNKRMKLLMDSFIEAFPEENCKLYLFGDGLEKKNIELIINKKDLCNRIILMGRKTRAELATFYRQADAFVLLSEKETFGVAYIEAMASGLPVISCHSGGPEEFINEKVGIVTESTVKDVARALKEIRENINMYDSSYICQYVDSICSASVIAEKLGGIYKSFERGK